MCLLAVTASAASDVEKPEEAAETAALAWLGLIDAGNYARSWTDAAFSFRQRISQSQWQTAAANARSPFGALKSRALRSATLKSTLPGAPDGQYVVIQYASSFEHKASAIETVTPMLDTDGKWRVSGYYIN